MILENSYFKKIINNNLFYFFIFFLVLFLTIFHTFTYGFNYDDRQLVTAFLEVPLILKFQAAREYAKFHFYPIYFLTHMFDDFLTYKLIDISGYLDERRMIISRISNAIFHLINSCILFKILQKIFYNQNKYIIFFGVLFFLMHPIISQPLYNVTSRNELLYLLFSFLAFNHSFKFIEKNKGIDLFIVNIYFFLALCSKLFSIFFIILIPGFFILKFYSNHLKKGEYTNIVTLFLSLIFTFSIYYYLRSLMVNTFELEIDKNFFDNFFSAFYFYFRGLFFPIDHLYLVIDHGNIRFGKVLFLISIILFFFSIYLFFKRKNFYFLFYFLWSGSALALPLYFGLTTPQSFPLISEMAERYSYGAAPTISILVILLIAQIPQKNFQKIIMNITFIFLLSVMIFLLIDRSKVYKDDYVFWSNGMLEHKPHLYYNIVPATMHTNIGFSTKDEKNFKRALLHLHQNYILFPQSVTNLKIMIKNYANWGKPEHVKGILSIYEEKFGEYPGVLFRRAQAFVDEKDYLEAKRILSQIENLISKEKRGTTPNVHFYDKGVYNFSPDDFFFLQGVVHSNLDLKQEAFSYFKKAYSYNFLHSTAMYNAGVIAKELGDKKTAIELIGNAIKINPKFKNFMKESIAK